MSTLQYFNLLHICEVFAHPSQMKDFLHQQKTPKKNTSPSTRSTSQPVFPRRSSFQGTGSTMSVGCRIWMDATLGPQGFPWQTRGFCIKSYTCSIERSEIHVGKYTCPMDDMGQTQPLATGMICGGNSWGQVSNYNILQPCNYLYSLQFTTEMLVLFQTHVGRIVFHPSMIKVNVQIHHLSYVTSSVRSKWQIKSKM